MSLLDIFHNVEDINLLTGIANRFKSSEPYPLLSTKETNMQIPAALFLSYGKWLMIPDVSNADGFCVMDLDEFAEQSEHITLEAAEDETRYAYSRNGDASLEVFTGV